REQLEAAIAQTVTAHDLRSGGDPRQQRYRTVQPQRQQLIRGPGGDDDPRPGIQHRLELPGIQYGAGPHAQLRAFAGQQTTGAQPEGGPQGDLLLGDASGGPGVGHGQDVAFPGNAKHGQYRLAGKDVVQDPAVFQQSHQFSRAPSGL